MVKDTKLLYENIIVSELTDDLVVSSVPLLYDSDSPYMFCNIETISTEAYKNIGLTCESIEDIVLIIKRYAKEEYLPGYYFISAKDVRGYITRENYSQMCK